MDHSQPHDRTPPAARIALVCCLLVLFLVGVKLLGASFKMVGEEQAAALFRGLNNPFAGLAVGILATVLVQSSSVTTSAVVGLVGAGDLSVGAAVPVIMGANIGTSVTNTLVSVGHVGRRAEFRRAFAGATMHDFFNLMTVVILLPFELMTGFLQRSATWLTGLLTFEGMAYKSPIKVYIGKLSKSVIGVIEGTLGLTGWVAAGATLAVGLLFIMVGLLFITRNMRQLLIGRLEEALNRVLSRSGFLGMGVGVLLTVSVQSSSVTTSLLVPLIGAGVLTLRSAFPITLGANIGTTVTALLAAMAAEGSAGLTIALVHLLFNCVGIGLLYPIPAVRHLPIVLAERLGDAASKNRLIVPAYILVVFVIIPLLGVLLFKA